MGTPYSTHRGNQLQTNPTAIVCVPYPGDTSQWRTVCTSKPLPLDEALDASQNLALLYGNDCLRPPFVHTTDELGPSSRWSIAWQIYKFHAGVPPGWVSTLSRIGHVKIDQSFVMDRIWVANARVQREKEEMKLAIKRASIDWGYAGASPNPSPTDD